jgi:HlyD family secretion protein
MANEGSRSEDRAGAVALVSQARQAFREAVAWRDEQVLISPLTGEVAKKIANRGEVVAAGSPLLTIIDPRDVWVVLNVKEDEMPRFRMGAKFDGTVKALGDSTMQFYVAYIAPMADFATWRPTNQKGGFDLKTFEVHLKPITPGNALRAGMSVQVRLTRMPDKNP